MEWKQNATTIGPTYMNMSLWGRIKVAWEILRNKTEFKVTVYFASQDDALYVDNVDGRWVTKGDK